MSVDVFLYGTDIGSYVAIASKTSVPLSAYVNFCETAHTEAYFTWLSSLVAGNEILQEALGGLQVHCFLAS